MLAPEERRARRMYSACKSRAKKKGIPFDLNYEAFRVMIEWNCAYCGSKPSCEPGHANIPSFNGMDRVYSSKGYTDDNVIPCCWKCNWAKSIMTQNEFIEWIKTIAENMHTSIWGSDHPVSMILAKLEHEQKARMAAAKGITG